MKNPTVSEQSKKKLHIAARLVCLLLAFVIWFIVAGISGENYKRTFSDIEVVLVGEDRLQLDGYSVEDFEKTLKVTVMGDHSKVIGVTAKDIRVEVDVAAVKGISSTEQTLKIPAVVRISPKLEGITAYGEYTVSVTVKKNPEQPDPESGDETSSEQP